MSRQPYQLYPYTPGGYSYPRAASPAATRTWVSQVITPFDEEPLFIPPIPTPSPPPSLPLSYHTQPGPRGHLAHVGSQDPALPYQYAAQPLPSQRGAPSSSYSMYERTTYGPSHSAPSTDPSVMLVDWIENRISDDAVMTATSRVLNSPKSMRFRFTVAGSDGEWRIVAQWAERVAFPPGICDRVQLELMTPDRDLFASCAFEHDVESQGYRRVAFSGPLIRQALSKAVEVQAPVRLYVAGDGRNKMMW